MNLLEQTLSAATRDVKTTDTDSTPLRRLPDGCKLRSAVTHVDERGSLFEIYSTLWQFDNAGFDYVYGVTIRPGVTKGWALHKRHEDRYFILQGDMKVVLYDPRPDSSTCGQVFEIVLSGRAPSLLNIPIHVWHADQNVGSQDVLLLNMPTLPYDHENPDKYRLPLDTDLIPYRFKNTHGW